MSRTEPNPPTSAEPITLAARWPVWQDLVEAMQPATLLVVIHSRLTRDLGVEAEDILQEAVARAWQRREQTTWLGFRATRSWLLTIADNCIADARDHAKALKRGGGNVTVFSSLTRGGAPPLDAGRSTTPSKVALYREHAAILRSAFEELPDDVREITRLRLMEQLSVREIASHIGLPLATVQHRIRRGSELFRERVRSKIASTAAASAPNGAVNSVSMEDPGDARDQLRPHRQQDDGLRGGPSVSR